ncbi:MAG: hypothetical protein E7643_09435 [Ruminococcaceae bacterium]|nr:hypothetical protein [Oscillospiraceae bacterium]
MAAFLILLSGMTGLVEGILIKKYNAKHTKGGFLFTGIVSLFSMLFFVGKVLASGNGFCFPNGIFTYALISGILFCTASFLTYVALGCGPFAISMLILSYSGVFSIAYGLVFLGEWETASPLTYAGLFGVMLSLFLTRGAPDGKGGKNASFKWLICIGLSLVGSGMFGVLNRMQQIEFADRCSDEYMVITLGISAAVLLTVGIVRDGKDMLYILRHGGLYAAASGLSNGATNMMGLMINTMMPLSLSSPIRAGVKVIFSFILSKVIFRETFLVRQIIGVGVGALALVLLNL